MAEELNHQERLFVDAYVATLDARASALQAGYSTTTARTKAFLWVSSSMLKPHVYAAVREKMALKSENLLITQQMVMERLWRIATADPNDLIELRRIACRFCHGEGFAYQWTDQEFAKACSDAEKSGSAIPDFAGGFGFDTRKDPHPDCPECNGLGVEQVVPKDTRDLNPSARALYAGVEVTKQGLKIKTQDQVAALQLVGKHLGMFVDRKELSGPDGAPLMPTTIRLEAATGDDRDDKAPA